MSTNSKNSSSAIQSVQRAATILRCFTQTDSDLGVTALSQQLGWHKSTVSRLLSTLEQEGFVEQNLETGKYRLGLGLVTLAGIVLDRIDLREIAFSYISELAELTQETVNIVVLNGNECMNIGGAASPRPIQYVGRIGRRTPVHCTAAGKVLLAQLTPEALYQVLPEELPRLTSNTIVDRKVFEQELIKIRRLGYATSHEEEQEGLSAIAAPVCDHSTNACAAVAVSGPTYRLDPDEIEAFVGPLLETTHKISRQLGCVPAM